MHLDHVLKRIDFGRLKPTERTRYINRIRNVVAAIEQHFPHVKHPEQIRLKHVQYFRNVWLKEYSESKRTKNEYMRAAGVLVRALGRSESWLGALGINSCNEQGGRPSKIRVRQTVKYYR